MDYEKGINLYHEKHKNLITLFIFEGGTNGL